WGGFNGLAATLGNGGMTLDFLSNPFNASEKTQAAFMRDLYEVDLGGHCLYGDIGVRVVRTQTKLNSIAMIDGVKSLINTSTHYIDALPSATLQFALTDRVNLRASANTTITCPSFSDMNPNLSFSAGNPT